MTPPLDPERYVPVSALYGSVARLLRGASLVLALLFLLRVLMALGPLGSGVVAVAFRFCDALVSQAPIAVLVVCLVGLSLLIDEESPSSRRLARHLQTLAIPVAIGYLLLIPLYAATSWSRSQEEARALRQGLGSSISQLRQARQEVLRARSSRELERILQELPAGSPPLSRFGPDLPRQRSALVTFLDRVLRVLHGRLEGAQRRLLGNVLRDTGLFSLACLGLAALFQRSSQLDFHGLHPWSAPRSVPSRRRRRRGVLGELDRDIEYLIQQNEPHQQQASEADPETPFASTPPSLAPPPADRSCSSAGAPPASHA